MTVRLYTASFSSFAGRKATFLLALILMASPVAGFRPIRAYASHHGSHRRARRRLLEQNP